MDAQIVPALSIVELDDEIKEREIELQKAVVATGLRPEGVRVCIRDVYLAIEKEFGSNMKPVAITRFDPDFVIQFATVQQRNVVLSYDELQGYTFSAYLRPWTPSYRSTTIYWHIEVAIDVLGLPSHACSRAPLDPLLSPHCSIQDFQVNKRDGIYRAIGYAYSKESVPTFGSVAFQYSSGCGVGNDTFPVTLKTYLRSEAPEFKEDHGPNSPVSMNSLDTADQFGVDRDALHEFYSQQRDLDVDEPVDDPTGSPTYCRDDVSEHGWESDRSWHLY